MVKTRQEIAYELGISRRTLTRWLHKHNIILPSGLVSVKNQQLIRKKFEIEHDVS